MLRKLMFLIAILLFGLPATAPAATYLISISGNISKGTDIPGVFGTSGASLVGLPFSASFSYDPTLGIREKMPNSDTLYGGDVDGDISPSDGLTFLLGGKTFKVRGRAGTAIVEANDPGSEGYSYFAFQDQTPSPYGLLIANSTFFIWHPNSPQSNLENPYTGSDLSGWGQLSFSQQINGGFYPSLSVEFEKFNIAASSTGSPATAVPEPTSWAMMIAGFGVIGGAMRRRSVKGTPLAA